jgi:hypothetical protein
MSVLSQMKQVSSQQEVQKPLLSMQAKAQSGDSATRLTICYTAIALLHIAGTYTSRSLSLELVVRILSEPYMLMQLRCVLPQNCPKLGRCSSSTLWT